MIDFLAAARKAKKTGYKNYKGLGIIYRELSLKKFHSIFASGVLINQTVPRQRNENDNPTGL